MAITKPPVLPAWAESGDKVTPSNAEIQVGWPLSSIPPSRQRFNWLLNFLANGIRYFSRRGLPDYDAAETYMIGDRIIGDDGKTYRSLIDNNTGQTPSAQPTKWERWGFTFSEFAANVTTPPQFDNDISLATTEFVQRALGNVRATYSRTGNQVLEVVDIGCHIVAGNDSADRGYTMPLLSALPIGASLEITNLSGKLINLLQRSGSDLFIGAADSSGTATSFAIKARQSIVAKKYSENMWLVTGSADEYASVLFSASIATSGYQRLPSGLILQWGVLGDASWVANTFRNISYPVAFPNAVLQHTAVLSNSAGIMGRVNTNQLSASQLQLAVDYSGAATVRWMALGH